MLLWMNFTLKCDDDVELARPLAPGKWQWPGMEWSWDKISISTWGMPPLHRRFNESEIKFKLRFDVVFVDNTLQHLELDDPAAGCIVGSPEVCVNKSTTPRCNTLDECRVYMSSIAAPVKARQKNHQKTLGYRGIVIAWWNFVTKEHADWWLRDPVTGIVKEGVLDWRNKDAAAYFVDKVIGEATWTDTSMDGVFVDSGFAVVVGTNNLTLKDRQDFVLAELEVFRKIAVNMAAHGKVITVSLKSHFSNVSDAGGARLCPKDMALTNRTPCLPYGEEKYFEILGPTKGWIPFRQYNIPSRDFGDTSRNASTAEGCAAAIENLKYEGQCGPSFATNKDGAPDGGMLQGQHDVSLAAYLLAAQPGSYFSSGHGWSDDAPPCKPSNPDCGYTTGNMVWWPEWDKKLGPPKADYARDGMVFTREFEHLSVSLDCSKVDSLNGGAAKLVWKNQ